MTSLVFNTYESESEAGYGTAARGLQRALFNYVDFFNGSQNILNFLQPRHFEYRDFTIGYTPWESTKLPNEWTEHIKRVDDMWTTASWLKPLFEEVRQSEVFVLPHGIDDEWVPIRHYREESRPFTFVHMGEPAVRKGGDIVLKAWHKAFKNNRDVKLIYKAKGHTANLLTVGLGGSENIEVIDNTYNRAEIWKLFALADCMVYPSRGEGFGFIPLEAMATGLPTIVTADHMGDRIAEYGIPLGKTKLVESNDQLQHPGEWLDHNISELVKKMNRVIDKFDQESQMAYINAKNIHEDFNWHKIGKMASDRIELMLNSK